MTPTCSNPIEASAMEFLREGSAQSVIDEAKARQCVQALLDQLRQRGPLKRVLILPPDMTRLHSWAGFLTCELYEQLHRDADLAILPAVGTHLPMTADELAHMFPGLPALGLSRSRLAKRRRRHRRSPGGAGPAALRGEARFFDQGRAGSAASRRPVGRHHFGRATGAARGDRHRQSCEERVRRRRRQRSDQQVPLAGGGARHRADHGPGRHAGAGGPRLCQPPSRRAFADRLSVDGARPG